MATRMYMIITTALLVQYVPDFLLSSPQREGHVQPPLSPRIIGILRRTLICRSPWPSHSGAAHTQRTHRSLFCPLSEDFVYTKIISRMYRVW
eukprot:scaffold189124_cov27-Tisochrysis_lutea.AAC.1